MTIGTKLSRRKVIKGSALGVITSTAVGSGLISCNTKVEFLHGVASGDPLADAIVLWTRVTPHEDSLLAVYYELALDESFHQVIASGVTITSPAVDYTVKFEATGLEANQAYFYRFSCNGNPSPTGRTRTLPQGHVEKVALAVVSCANFPTGYFNVYREIANNDHIDFVVHLGDYIYEYGMGEYGSEDAEALSRVPKPSHECLTLKDYRQRYSQYHQDPDLRALHQRHPMICTWDDHEVANDTWKNGAENHDESEGDFAVRKAAAQQAYFEYLPIRAKNAVDHATVYRSFAMGDLLDLVILDTRHLGREKSLNIKDFLAPSPFGTYTFSDGTGQAFFEALEADRPLLGEAQREWLYDQISESVGRCRWQVLGQQVLMATNKLPFAVATQQMALSDFAFLGGIAILAQRASQGDPTLTPEEIATLQANKAKLTPAVMSLLMMPAVPYNLDAWDGYPQERQRLLAHCQAEQANLITLAGDTHNAWSSKLTSGEEVTDGQRPLIGYELATASVTSPGLEVYLGLSNLEEAKALEAGVVQMVPDLTYLNCYDRGYMEVTFGHQAVTSKWHYVDSIKTQRYGELRERFYEQTLAPLTPS